MKSSSIAVMDLHTTEPQKKRSNSTNSTSVVVVAERSKKGDSEKRSLIGIRRRKRGKYTTTTTVFTGRIPRNKLWLGTFDTVEEAEKLSQQDKSMKNCDQIQASLSVDTAGVGSRRKKRIHSHKTTTTTHIVGVYKRKESGKYTSEIKNPITKRKIWLGTFDTAEEASRAYQSKKLEFDVVMQQQCSNKHTHSEQDIGKSVQLVSHERFQPGSAGGSEIDVPVSNSSNGGTDQMIDSHEIGTAEEGFCVYHSEKKQVIANEASKVFNSSLMANVHGAESYDESNTSTSCNPKSKISLIGVRKRKNGRYAAQITDRISHKQVWLGTFDTVEEASQVYLSKKSEFEKLGQQGKKENKPKKRCDRIQPESPVLETLNTASMGRRNKRIDSQVKEPGSSKATSCLMTNIVHGAESSGECNITTSCDPRVKRSLIGIRRRKSGRYGAAITDPIKHKEVWLGTFDTIEEASQAYLSKKSEFEKLSQQGNKEDKPKKNCDQIQQPESSPSVVASLDTASASGRDKRIDSDKTTTHSIGAHKSKKTGRYTSDIINPITKKKIWLGTFDTAEEASHTYQSKKLEFQKLVKAKQHQCSTMHTQYKQDGKSEKLVNVKQEHENVNCKLESAGGSEINGPISNSFSGGTDQRINSHETGITKDAFHAYLSKKLDSQSSKEVELQSNMSTDFSARKNQEGKEDDKDLWMGAWVQLPGDDRAVMFSLKLGLPIIDNYGSLLGEFSSLDDLSIS